MSRSAISRTAALLMMQALLSNCGGSNAMLLASGGPADLAAMGRVSDRYGSGEPDAVVPVAVGDQQTSFAIWISKDGRMLMVQTASATGAAAAGLVRGLTMGLVKGDQEYEPFERAAVDYLLRTRGPGCLLHDSRKLTHIGFEWGFDCPAPSNVSRRR